MKDSNATVFPNDYITLTIKNFKEEDMSKLKLYNRGVPALVSGLLKYENKTSVVHFKVTKHSSYTEEVRSKDFIQMHCGFRRFDANPIYSEYNVTCDKHKYEPFLHAGSTQIASIYGPISFPPMPLLMFKNNTSLVATGGLLTVNPDRIILKKIVLTGTPYKIHKRYAVVRHMFFNRGIYIHSHSLYLLF
jgi:pre-rRNA-processing protein TSR1